MEETLAKEEELKIIELEKQAALALEEETFNYDE